MPIEVVEKLRSELMTLKNWKAKATQEIVDRDRALADLENELIKQQSEFDISNEECVGHQKTIQELKSALDQVHTYILIYFEDHKCTTSQPKLPSRGKDLT